VETLPTKRRRWPLRVLLALLLIFASFAIYVLYFGPTVQEQFDRIEIGSQLSDVERLLGRPSDIASRMKGRIENDAIFVANANPPPDVRDHYRFFNLHQWNASELTIIVVTDDDGKVACKYTSKGVLASWYQRLLDAVKRGLHLR
jgi:hypothetical protein